MSNIRINFRDGSKKEFLHEGRAGGGYTKKLTFEGVFAVIQDEWYKRTIFPAELIESIDEWPVRNY